MGKLLLATAAVVAGTVLTAPVAAAGFGSSADPGFWDGFYLGILGGAGASLSAPDGDFQNLGIAAGAGATTNEGFYFGAEAFFAAETFEGSDPYLWLEGDGRVGLVVDERVLVFGSGGIAYDADAEAIALTGGGGAEFAVTDDLSMRGQYAIQYYPNGLGTFHQGLVGLFWRLQ